ncbi:MAG: hypothetical protein GXX86_04265 [Propionibacterium sp.]|nr:hypothetical protein [Propionibacterium sp.]
MTDAAAVLGRIEGVPSAVRSGLDAVDTLLRDRGMRTVPAEESAKALHAGARANAAIADRDEPAPDGTSWEAGAVRAATQVLELAPMIRKEPGQVIARVHALVARGYLPEEELGRLRDDPGVGERMVGLHGLLTTPTEASALVVAAIAHAELATVRPFGTGDGIVARLVEHLVLIEAGIDPRAVVVAAAGHRAAGAEYNHALTDYAEGGPVGVREWILHCVRAVGYGAEVSPLASIPVRKQQGAPRGPRAE